MSRLPQVSGDDVARALKKIGYEHDHTRGSHMVLRQMQAPHRRVTIPRHDPVAKGTLRAIVREVGLSVDQFVALLTS